MKNVLKVFGIIALGIIGFSCSSSASFIALDKPVRPDSKSAVVIFFGRSFTKAQVWDGEKPVGTFDGTPLSTMNHIFWKTTPGAHTFVARSSNYVNKRMNLQADKTYYIQIDKMVVSPPFTTLIFVEELTQKGYDEVIEKWKKAKNKLTLMEFDNKWRTAFLAENNGKNLKDIREYLKTAK